MIQSNLFQYGDEVEWQQAGAGVLRQVLGFDDKLMLVKVKFSKGSRGTLHSHAHSQVSYVESGVFEMTMGDTIKIISKGDGYYVPPFTVHGCVCLEEGMLVDAFSPARWDFITLDGKNYVL
ncbi:cupin domain-containing protein [Mucilaginibacter ginsenosidivorax]|uniref:Cupin domain-containing protein n=1 Tax=Mucilaginibacter ginsenosidivorax TaxID=862126 RepID=A0A5B8VV92_9SPHI|nr:cupin domain-containing protein [Mucilaginibacter ginsenosidivorax]QEC75193.1 cupin domain-containing protein [Mucilaginibacter ginsenosidivorax]